MTAITVQSFLSAASGNGVAIALIRGFARRRARTQASITLRYEPFHVRAAREINPEFRYGEVTVYEKTCCDDNDLKRSHVDAVACTGRNC